jgi:VanZ family protein
MAWVPTPRLRRPAVRVPADGGVRRARLLLAGYLVVVALLTLPPLIEPWLLGRIDGLVERLSGPATAQTIRWVEPGLNVALFVPLAFLLCAAAPRLPRPAVWLFCVVGTAAVELTQYLFLPGRTGSLRDVLTNSTGALIGVVLHRLVAGRRGTARGRPGQSVRQQ